ncbi:MAG: VWA domain-containing protein [Holophagales bacterium]|nr:VWA domain-containing protein [Holophagales bacterium]MYG29114.1 VWA domain-containing protein [Holophagales bacterium]MYI80566.1 VWA domain-containing protein [Holophagales bacterium]
MKRFATVGRRLALAGALASGAFLLSTGFGFAVAADDAVGVEAAVQDDEKKKRKAEKKAAARAAKEQKRLEKQRRQRGRTVRAVVVPSEPTEASEPATAPAVEPAAAPATEPAVASVPERAPAPTPAPEPEQPRAAQPAPAPAPARDISLNERIRVAEVLLDVLVTDRKGNVIEGLDAEDFVVLHDGEEQEVTSASFYGGPSELASPGGGGTARTDRYFILMFHDQRMQAPQLAGPQMDNARWLKRWIEEELQPNDQVAVFAYQARLKVYLDFTRDRAEILAAVDAASTGKRDIERWVTRSDPEFDPNSPSLFANLPAGKELSRRSRKLQEALELVGEAAAGIAGRKNLVMFSLGFGDIGQFGSYTPDPRYYPQMREALNAGNVAVYTIDTMGSRRRSIASASLNDSLSLISNETGGHYYANFTNILSPMRQVAEENQGYYLVSFRSEYEAGTEGYRNIKVKVRDGNYKVRSRTGFRYGESAGP